PLIIFVWFCCQHIQLCKEKRCVILCICCCYIGYFSALSKGDILPTKERLERPGATQKTDTRLTPGLLKVLNKQIVSNPQNDTRPPHSYLVL
uniref:Uncharacterized protein n=1 Tax=Oncorhynchus tshawytscha TaxID=74940 RepID=A0A8C8IRH8_ONCTS